MSSYKIAGTELDKTAFQNQPHYILFFSTESLCDNNPAAILHVHTYFLALWHSAPSNLARSPLADVFPMPSEQHSSKILSASLTLCP